MVTPARWSCWLTALQLSAQLGRQVAKFIFDLRRSPSPDEKSGQLAERSVEGPWPAQSRSTNGCRTCTATRDSVAVNSSGMHTASDDDRH
jgi:hypothetical protein